MKKEAGLLLSAIAILTGTIIGAGVLAIPYAVMKAGFLTGALILAVLSISSILVYLYMGEVVLRTKKKHQLTGYAEKYLGAAGKNLMAFTMVFGIYGALIAYLIGVGESLVNLFSLGKSLALFGFALQTNILFSLLFFILASSIVYLGIKAVGKSELIIGIFVVGIILFLSVFAILKMQPQNLADFDITKIFLPYGVILFALAGAVAVPEMREEIEGRTRIFRKAIIIGALIPILLYFLFSLGVVGACGNKTTEIATFCLGQRLGSFIFIFGNLFAILAMGTSFLTLGLGLKGMYMFDYKLSEKKSWILACLLPLILFFLIDIFLKQERFFKTIGLAGGIAMTLEGILIVLMFHKAKKLGERKPEYSIKQNKIVSALIVLLFLLGMIYTILNFFGLL